MKNIKSWIALMAFSLVVLGLPAIASAQYRGQNDDDDYYNNGRYGNNGGYNNGRYGNNNGYGNIRSTIQSLKYKARNFEQTADNSRGYNNGGYGGGYGGYGNNRNNGRYNSRNIENLADRFSDAVDRLEDKYGRGRNLDNSADEARRVLEIARQIDSEMYNMRRNDNLSNEWNGMSNDLRTIAREYGYRYNGNTRSNRWPNGNNGGWGNGQKPSWWPF